MVRKCYETFSFVLHEALASGVIPITNEESGNIYHLCNELKIPHVKYTGSKKINLTTSGKIYVSGSLIPASVYAANILDNL